MTAIIFNQHSSSMKTNGKYNKPLIIVGLPLIAVAITIILGFTSQILPVLVVSVILSTTLVLGISGKGKDEDGVNGFIMRLDAKHEFTMAQAKVLLKKYNAEIYRIDSKTHTLQFFLNKKKYTMQIKK